ncbi:hypothetical protein EYF80_026320 [Liparis tanakae]|uniref:Uncharacterized protein n=1 Tax=Liparis tanakae TaxID=230148 RepID=A0A4Z2HD80_9TELE|nr:hypothetical protein EYF80_026320 [Liparis tanakae]
MSSPASASNLSVDTCQTSLDCLTFSTSASHSHFTVWYTDMTTSKQGQKGQKGLVVSCRQHEKQMCCEGKSNPH